MMIKIAKIISIFAVIMLMGVPFLLLAIYGKSDDLIVVFASIASVSGLVFTVAGLWAGFVFPDAIRIILGKASTEEKANQLKEYGNILVPVLIALMCTVVATAAPIIGKVLQLWSYPSWLSCTLKIGGSIIAYALSLLMLWAIAKVISPSIHWYNILDRRTRSEEAADHRMPKQ